MFLDFFARKFEHLTSPGLTVPTAGDTVSGAPPGTTNSNDVGPTSTMGPEPILGTGWVNSLALVCELMTSIWAEHVSLTAVAFIFITECDSSSGGRTPTARQWILNSRPIPVLQVRSNSYSCKNNKQRQQQQNRLDQTRIPEKTTTTQVRANSYSWVNNYKNTG